MPGITVNCHVNAPVERVFANASNFAEVANYIDDITKTEMLTDGPVGVGTRFKETRVMFKRECTEVMEITEFEPNKRYVLHADSHGCLYITTFTFTPEGDGTKVTMDFRSEAHGLMAKLMTPLAKMMTKTLIKCVEKDMACLKAHSERTEAEAVS